MSDRLSSLKSGRSPPGMVSPRMSDNPGARFGVAFSNYAMAENMSVKSTKTGILKEVSQNAPRLTQMAEKKDSMRSPDIRHLGSWTSEADIPRQRAVNENKGPSYQYASHKKTSVASNLMFREVGQLEALVNRKDDLVVLIDENEAEIEKLVGKLTSKKRSIREEQNKLLKELEDLGLKLKDFDKPVGINLRNCTVVSPYLTRCSQQVINKLRGVTENISNKETKDEIFRAIKSITVEREERENLVISLLSLDTSSLRERLAMLQEDLEGKNSEKAETISKLECLAAEIGKLNQVIEDDKNYQDKLSHLQLMKNNAVLTATNTAEVLKNILSEKNSIESEIRLLHQTIRGKVELKNSVNSNLTDFLDSLQSESYSNMKLWMKEFKDSDNSSFQFLSDFLSTIRTVDVWNQIDLEFSSSHSVAATKELVIGVINLIGRVVSMMGRTNAENAIKSFKSDYLLVPDAVTAHPGLLQVVTTLANTTQDLLPYKFDQSPIPDEIEAYVAKLKAYLSELAKNLENFYEMTKNKLELNESVANLMSSVLLKEHRLLELNREQAKVVNSIPEIKNQTRSYNYQLAQLLVNNANNHQQLAEDQPRETADDCEDGLPRQWNARPADDSNKSKQELLEDKLAESKSAETRAKQLTEDAREVADHIRRIEHEQEYIIEKVKTYRRGLIEGLHKEMKEFQCIASLFDYMSKPILSREIGVSVMDSLLHDLAGVIQQINSEVNRQKRIIKLVNKNEDYSHEGSRLLTSREDLR